MKVFTSGNKVQAAGQANLKPAGQTTFPANPNEMQAPASVPVMLEAQFYDEDTT